jgi:hypothetical protein
MSEDLLTKRHIRFPISHPFSESASLRKSLRVLQFTVWMPTLAMIALWYHYVSLKEVGYLKNVGNSAIWKDKMP